MNPWCGLFRRKGGHQDVPRRRRQRTFSLFGNSNEQSRWALGRLVGATAFAKPHDESASDSATATDLGAHMMSTDMRDILESLYRDLCHDGNALLSRHLFHRFLVDVQGEDPSRLDADRPAYTAGEFLYSWIKCYGIDALAPPSVKDLDKPITNYFINSSHNTYLDGHQWTSKSTPEAYKSVLSRGCRCIEIDVWNGDAPAPSRDRTKSPHADKGRGLSGSSLSSAALSIVETFGDKYETARLYLGDRAVAGHRRSRSPSANRDALAVADDASPRTSAVSVSTPQGPRESGDLVDVGRVTPRPRALPRGEPIVTHGWTLTIPCGFRDVCEAIKESAFVDNDLPVIISLEVHADLEQQEVMVSIMKEVWHGLLVSEPHEGCDPRFRVPNLGELRNKILVKVKRAAAKMVAGQGSGEAPVVLHAVDDDDNTSRCHDDAALPPHSSLLEKPAPTAESSARARICDSLADLAVYTRSQRFEGLQTPHAKSPVHVLSMSENRILDMYHKHHRDVFVHNKRYFMRAFPNVRRIDSSNPDPSLFWRKGVQMVALNWQNLDEGMMVNEGMFADEKGWVLKPPGYQSSDKASDTQALAAPGCTMDLSITVFAGHNLPTTAAHADGDCDYAASASAIRPLVKVELHVERPGGTDSSSGGVKENSYKRRTDAKKSSNPYFGSHGKTLEFRAIPKVVTELSFVRFKIEDESRTGFVGSPLLAWSCIRLDRLRPGYRFVRLMDAKGHTVPGAKLLVKVSKTLR